jgi:iron complex outermembrane recepter protein
MNAAPRRHPLAAHIASAFGAVSGAFLLAMPGVPWAQTAPAPKPDTGEIQSVTVTANRRAEDQQKVSVSVTAVTGLQLTERNVTDLSQMESLSAGFTFSRSGVDARPSIRGVRTENVAVNADTTIGYFVDGVYRSRAQQAMLGFVDVARVEILRGPQGTLFGRNTFGGSVAITTVEPELRSREMGASLELGNFSKKRFDGLINVPLGDTVAVRFAAMVERSDAWVRDDFNPAASLFDKDVKYLRGSIKIKPSREFEAVLRADVTDQKGNGGSAFGYKLAGTYLDNATCQQLFNASFLALNTRGGNRDNVNDCTRTQGAGAGTGANAAGTGVDLGIPLYAAGNMARIDNDYQPFLKLKDSNFSADLTYRLPMFSLKSITGYADFSASRSQDTDFSASTIGIDFQKTSAKTMTQEFQILSEGSGPLSYVAGLYLFKDQLTGLFINQQLTRTIRSAAAPAAITLAQNGAGFYDLQRPETASTAVYGQLSYKAMDAVTVTAGARYTRDKKSFRYANANAVLPLNGAGAPDGTLITLDTAEPGDAAFGTTGTSNCTGTNNQPGFNCLTGANGNVITGATYADATFSKTTGKLAVDYSLSKDHLLYASVSNGFRSGGFNSGQVIESLRTFKPEGVTALELGSKSRLMGNTLQLNLAAFNNAYTNLQEQRQVPVGNTTVSTIFNAAKAKATGLEAELQWRQSRDLTLGGTLSLLDAKYTSFPDVALPFGTSILVADASVTTAQTDANGVVLSPAGQRRVFAPGYNCSVVPGTGGTGQPAAAFGCDLTGKRLPYAPKYQGSVFVRYDIGLSGGAKITPMLVATFSSGYYGQPTNAEIERQGSYVKTDFKLNWRFNDAFSLMGYVDNMSNTQTINRFVWGGGGNLQVSAASPRTFGLKVAYTSF